MIDGHFVLFSSRLSESSASGTIFIIRLTTDTLGNGKRERDVFIFEVIVFSSFPIFYVRLQGDLFPFGVGKAFPLSWSPGILPLTCPKFSSFSLKVFLTLVQQFLLWYFAF